MAFIEIAGITKTFGAGTTARHVLDGASLSVEQGEFVSIVGTMGCGKSTFLKIVAGLLIPEAGDIRFGGERARGIRNDAAIVFQNYSLLPWFSALENVRLAVAATFPAWPRSRHVDQARRYLEKVGLGTAIHRRPSQLSGGMRQRVAIARAFATEPSILFLDEPFGALDALTRGSLQQELGRLCGDVDAPVTTIMITNSLEEAMLLSDRIVPMTKGPCATLGSAVAVEMSKPRTHAALAHDEEALRVRNHVIESLTASIDRARPAVVPARADAAHRRTEVNDDGLDRAPAVARLNRRRSEA
jgi:nitrate/nitrite transport system ATP-binding protein